MHALQAARLCGSTGFWPQLTPRSHYKNDRSRNTHRRRGQHEVGKNRPRKSRTPDDQPQKGAWPLTSTPLVFLTYHSEFRLNGGQFLNGDLGRLESRGPHFHGLLYAATALEAKLNSKSALLKQRPSCSGVAAISAPTCLTGCSRSSTQRSTFLINGFRGLSESMIYGLPRENLARYRRLFDSHQKPKPGCSEVSPQLHGSSRICWKIAKPILKTLGQSVSLSKPPPSLEHHRMLRSKRTPNARSRKNRPRNYGRRFIALSTKYAREKKSAEQGLRCSSGNERIVTALRGAPASTLCPTMPYTLHRPAWRGQVHFARMFAASRQLRTLLETSEASGAPTCQRISQLADLKTLLDRV